MTRKPILTPLIDRTAAVGSHDRKVEAIVLDQRAQYNPLSLANLKALQISSHMQLNPMLQLADWHFMARVLDVRQSVTTTVVATVYDDVWKGQIPLVGLTPNAPHRSSGDSPSPHFSCRRRRRRLPTNEYLNTIKVPKPIFDSLVVANSTHKRSSPRGKRPCA